MILSASAWKWPHWEVEMLHHWDVWIKDTLSFWTWTLECCVFPFSCTECTTRWWVPPVELCTQLTCLAVLPFAVLLWISVRSSVFLSAPNSQHSHRVKLIQFWLGDVVVRAYCIHLHIELGNKTVLPQLPLVAVQADSILFKYVYAGDLEFCMEATELRLP